MTCAHCGTRVDADAERCPSCGSPQRVAAGPRRAVRPTRGQGPARTVAVFLALGAFGALGIFAGMFLYLSPSDLPRVSAPDTRPATGGFAGVRARGKLRVAADPDAAPFLSRTATGWEGFEYGVMSAVAAEAGVPLELVPARFSELPDRLRDGAADLAVGQLSPTTAWTGLAWSVSYLQYSLCLVVPAGSPARALPDLRGKRVGMYDDPVTTQVAALGIGADYARVVFDDYGYFERLARGSLDAVVYDCPLARWELRAFGDELRVADAALNVATYNVAVRADDPALQADVNRVLRGLGDQGLLARLEARWLGGTAPADGYATATGRVVVVKRGETLRDIAARELGSADRWTELHARNRDLVGDDPDALYAGLRLRLADAPIAATGTRSQGRPARRP